MLRGRLVARPLTNLSSQKYGRGITFVFFSHPSSHSPLLLPLPPTPQINFKSRLGTHYVGNNCTMNTAWTDFHTPPRESQRRGTPLDPTSTWGSLPCTTSGIDILIQNLVCIQGLYKIFNKVFACFLDPGEWVEANKGYHG